MSELQDVKKALENMEKAFIASRASAEPLEHQFAKHVKDNKKDFKRIEDKLDPILEIISKAKNAGAVSNWFFTALVKFFIGAGVIIGAIMSVKHWIMK